MVRTTEAAENIGGLFIFLVGKRLERETGIEPATNGLGSRYSTIELLPPNPLIIAKLLPARLVPLAR